MKALISKGFIALLILISQFSTAFAQQEPWYHHRPLNVNPNYLPPNTGMYQQGGYGYGQRAPRFHYDHNPQASAGKAFIGIGVAFMAGAGGLALNRVACHQPFTRTDGVVLITLGSIGAGFTIAGGIVLGTSGNSVGVKVPLQSSPGKGRPRRPNGKYDPWFNF